MLSARATLRGPVPGRTQSARCASGGPSPRRGKGDAPPPADEAPAARAGADAPGGAGERGAAPKEAFERAAERVAREARSAAEAEDAKAERTRQRVERKRARNRKRPPGGGEDAAALRAAKALLDGGDVEAARRAFKDLRDRACARATPRERPRSSSGSPGRDIPEVVARAKAKGDEWFREEKLEDAKVAYGAALEHLSRVGNLSAGDVEDEAKRTLRGVLLANRAACDCQAARAAAAAGETAAARAAYERVVRDCGEAVACSPRPYARTSGAGRPRALLRWHPDKFDLSKFHPDDRDAVSDAVAEVTRRIVKEKKFLA
ncbi:alpha-1,3-glucosidase [Aureococcus anophagefferens]|nr:alpha-1,3-glucosidase [Aureococcus anophagefferens]